MQHWQNAQVLVLLEQTPGGTMTNVPGRHLRLHSISGLSICSPHGDVYPQISAQAWLQNVQTPMLFPTGHYVVMGQCDSLVNYVTPVHTAAGGTGSVSDAESAKLSLAAQFIWSFCLSLFQARNTEIQNWLHGSNSILLPFRIHSRVIVACSLKRVTETAIKMR